MAETTYCRSCGKEIQWALSPNNKKIPLERIQVTYELDWDEENKCYKAIKKEGDIWQSHFLTCPQATNWSKKK